MDGCRRDKWFKALNQKKERERETSWGLGGRKGLLMVDKCHGIQPGEAPPATPHFFCLSVPWGSRVSLGRGEVSTVLQSGGEPQLAHLPGRGPTEVPAAINRGLSKFIPAEAPMGGAGQEEQPWGV